MWRSSQIFDGRWTRVGLVIVAAAVIGVVVWIVVRNEDASSTRGAESSGTNASATAFSEHGLLALSAALAGPIYWAGPKAGVKYEFTEAPDGRRYVRYLPKGAAVGTSHPYLTVGTYPLPNAFAATREAARRGDSVKIPLGNGSFAFYARMRPTNVYLASPDGHYQVEVFDPSPNEARRLVKAHRVHLVSSAAGGAAPARTTSVATSPSALRALSATLGRPVYWLGTAPGTYELTRTPDGRIYVRYLPAGSKIGVDRPYLTVGTYPMKDAFATTSADARQPASVRIPVDGGGIAFYSRAHPTSVYLAFPGVAEQIEVFDPSASRVHRLVAANRVHPVT